MAHRFTIGVEEEFQIVDPNTWELRSHVSQLLAAGSRSLGDQMKREMHQSIVEVGTNICEDVGQLQHEMLKIRSELCAAADRVGLAVAAAGTHPFSSWIDQVISPGERYENIVEELQQLARSLLIFGLHVHVAMPDKAATIDIMNAARYFLPHLLALSTSSPFWMGRDTGLKSYRTTIFRRLPADRRARPLRLVERVRELRQPADRPPLHRRRQEDLVGHPAASDVWHAGVPRVRRAHAGRGHDRHRGSGAGHHREAVQALHEEHGLPPLSPRADRREQVARRTLGDRRQPHRLRQEVRGADARRWPSS